MSLLRNLLLGVSLLVSCTAFCAASGFAAAGNNPYNGRAARIQQELASADTLHALALLDELASLADHVENREALLSFLKGTATQANDALVRTEAQAIAEELCGLEAGQPHTLRWFQGFQQDAERASVLQQATRLSGADGMQVRGRLEHLAGMADAGAEHMQQAAQLSPTPMRWRLAAEYSADPFKKFAALQAGLRLKSDDAQLNLELAVYYIGRQQLEKAQALLQQGLAGHADDFALRVQMAELHMNLGLRSSAMRELLAVERQWPAGPVWLERRLAVDYEQLGLLDDAARLATAALGQKPSDLALLNLLARFHEKRHNPIQLEADYNKLLRLRPEAPELWSKLAQVELTLGHLAEAKTSLLRLIALQPQNGDAHRQLAALYQRMHLPEAAQQQSSEALAAAKPRHVPDSAAAGLLSDPRKLAAAAFAHAPQQHDLALSDIRIQELYADGLNRVHVQQIFYTGSHAAAEERRVTGIHYSPASENLKILHARIWKPNGTVVEAQEAGETQVADGSTAMYYDMRSRQLRFVGLEKGDVEELDYSLAPTLSENPYPGYFGELVTLASRTPAQLRRYVLVLPSSQKIFAHAEKVAAAQVSEQDGQQTMVWELHDVPALPREARSPGITETSPYVHVSTLGDWQQLGSWYAGLIRSQFALDTALQQELAALIHDKPTDAEKIAAIQEFVLRSTHYVALEFGIYSYKPYPVAQTFARRFGDCKDKASLMIALLRAAGIEADIALVRTRSLGAVVPAPASLALFDHAIVYVPKYDLWLDGTAEYSGRELPLEDQGAMALTVSLQGSAQLRQIPMSSAHDNYTKRTIYAQLSPEGVIHFSGSTLTRGEDAPELRRELAVQEQQLDLFRRGLAEVFPMIELDAVAVHGAHNLESDVSVDFQGALNAYEHKPMVRLSATWMPRSYVSALAPSSARTLDLLLPSPWITEEEIHVALPAGAAVKELPRNQEATTSFGSVRLRYSRSGHEIVINSHLEFDKARIASDEYEDFRQFCSLVEHSFSNEIVVSLAR
jgi:transglutaminase-like putative cysteine protease/tetratricopeptide (TPR) repeat protein